MPPANMTSSIPDSSLEPIKFVLKSLDGKLDRVLTITNAVTCEVGRASKSSAKYYAPATDNALFDCPVMSRRHAEISTDGWPVLETTRVFITDLDSMHGTRVNGEKLTPHQRHLLRPGAVIKLGETVKRGEESHDGVIVEFHICEPEPVDHIEARAPRGFFFTSDSEHSELNSDNESNASLVAHPYSSAQTTPELLKVAPLGSQAKPIDLESPLRRSSPAVVDLGSDEKEELRIAHAPARIVVPDTYDDLEYLRVEQASAMSDGEPSVDYTRDETEEHVDDYDVDGMSDAGTHSAADDDHDSLSASDASDLAEVLSDHDDASDMDDLNDHFVTEIPAMRQLSPELGTVDGTFAHDETPAMAANITTVECSELLYDPVRSSQPPMKNQDLHAQMLNLEDNHARNSENSEHSSHYRSANDFEIQGPSEGLHQIAPYDEIDAEMDCNEPQISAVLAPAEDQHDELSSPENNALFAPPLYGTRDFNTAVAHGFGHQDEFPYTSPSTNRHYNRPANSSSFHIPPSEPSTSNKNKISIGYLVDPATTVQEEYPASISDNSQVKKRKMDHVTSEEQNNPFHPFFLCSNVSHNVPSTVVDIPNTATSTYDVPPATEAAAGFPNSRRIKTARRGDRSPRTSNHQSFRINKLKRYGVSAMKYSTAAAAGGAAMFCFLASSHSERLLELLS